MANRSYLYVVDEIPGPGRTPTIKALSEWRWDIPDAFRVLLSPAPQAVPSTIWSAPIQAVLGDYDAGLAAFERFLAALPPSPEVEEQAATALAALRDPARRGRYFLLEIAEMLEVMALPNAEGDVGDEELATAFAGELAQIEGADTWVSYAPKIRAKDLDQATGAGYWPSRVYFEPVGSEFPEAVKDAESQPEPPAPAPAPASAYPEPARATPAQQQPHLPPPPVAYAPAPSGYGPAPAGYPPAGYAPAPPGYYAQPGMVPIMMQPPSGLAWGFGFLALIPLPFLSALVTGLVMMVVGNSQKMRDPATTANGRNAANWGLTFTLVTAVVAIQHFTLIGVLADTVGFFPIGIGITLWLAYCVAHLVVCGIGLSRGNQGRVFKPWAIPFFREKAR